MKIAIVYKSITGNIEKIALTIKESLDDYDIVYFGGPKDNIEADLYIIGSWTNKGDCDLSIANFLKKLNNKKIIYFATAGYGGSLEYYDRLFERVRAKIADNNIILGSFFCQGKMPISVKNKYIDMIKANPNDKNLQVSIENFNNALSHPDSKDLTNAKEWIKELFSKENITK